MQTHETMLYENTHRGRDVIAHIKELNKQGWRLVQISHSSTCYWLERKLPDAAPASTAIA